jgi:O-antigen ligase
MRVLIGFTAWWLVDNFSQKYIKVIYWITICSFVFYFSDQTLLLVGVDVRQSIIDISFDVGDPSRINVLLYNYMTGDHSYRNAAIFWEPGAFAGYILVGLVLLKLNQTRMKKKQYRRNFVVLSLALLTTFSTMGYLVYPFALLVNMNIVRKIKNLSFARIAMVIVALPVVVYGAIMLMSLEFMGKKIMIDYQQAQEQEEFYYNSRLGAVVFDWEYIKRRPFFGWGINNKTRYMLNPELQNVKTGMGNGMSAFIAKMGFCGFLFFLLMVYRGFRNEFGVGAASSIYVLFVLILILQSEMFLNHPIFISFMFVGVSKKGYIRFDRERRNKGEDLAFAASS